MIPLPMFARSRQRQRPTSQTDHFTTNTIANYTEYADSTGQWTVNQDPIAGYITCQLAPVQSALAHNGTTFADGAVGMTITAGQDAGLVLRLLDKNNYYLMVVHDDTFTGGSGITVYAKVSNTYINIGSMAITWTHGTQVSFEFSAIGSSITCKFNGVTILSVTDTNLTAPGLGGMRSNGDNPPLIQSFTWPI